jgi:xanthine phosphoribosyltransferase
MKVLKDRITKDGKHLGNGILKVDGFMNHQIDPILMKEIGEEFARLFAGTNPTKILTAEASGIAPAVSAGMILKVPIVFAKKKQPITMTEAYKEQSISPTKGGATVELVVSSEYLGPEDRVLILDDFLSSARTIKALIKLIDHSGATLVGIGAVIEKSFSGGRDALEGVTVPVESLAVIKEMDGETIIFNEELMAGR